MAGHARLCPSIAMLGLGQPWPAKSSPWADHCRPLPAMAVPRWPWLAMFDSSRPAEPGRNESGEDGFKHWTQLSRVLPQRDDLNGPRLMLSTEQDFMITRQANPDRICLVVPCCTFYSNPNVMALTVGRMPCVTSMFHIIEQGASH